MVVTAEIPLLIAQVRQGQVSLPSYNFCRCASWWHLAQSAIRFRGASSPNLLRSLM